MSNEFDDQGRPHGYWEYLYNNGIKQSHGEWVNGVKNGIWSEYYSNGNIFFQGEFNMGVMTGIWEWREVDGTLISKELWINGKRGVIE
jgi:antitoxin component YwqK of YwqJK toxin-antitoxin module